MCCSSASLQVGEGVRRSSASQQVGGHVLLQCAAAVSRSRWAGTYSMLAFRQRPLGCVPACTNPRCHRHVPYGYPTHACVSMCV